MSEGPVDLRGETLLGIDLGEVRIGVASADRHGTIRGLPTLRRAQSAAGDAARLAVIAAELGATRLVVGLPLHADGAWSEQATRTASWAASVADRLGIALVYVDERFSSSRAAASLGPAPRGNGGRPPGPRRREARRAAVDRAAARLILADAADPSLCIGAESVRRAAHDATRVHG